MADSHIALSLDGATYETYASLFECLAGKAAWQQRPESGAGGWNVRLNDDDVNVFDVDDEGIWCRPPTDDTWESYGENRFIPWDDVNSIAIF
jgi:hypothetical protein